MTGNNPSRFKGSNLPVETVSWDDVQAFISSLTARSNDGYIYRLPTEAEWEYACRAGTTGDYGGSLYEMAWYNNNFGNQTHAVGSKRPNAWGLYDMHGNVWEWCSDWYGNCPSGAASDPQGASSGSYCVSRGGGCLNTAAGCRSAYRAAYSPGDRSVALGFRLVSQARQHFALLPFYALPTASAGATERRGARALAAGDEEAE